MIQACVNCGTPTPRTSGLCTGCVNPGLTAPEGPGLVGVGAWLEAIGAPAAVAMNALAARCRARFGGACVQTYWGFWTGGHSTGGPSALTFSVELRTADGASTMVQCDTWPDQWERGDIQDTIVESLWAQAREQGLVTDA